MAGSPYPSPEAIAQYRAAVLAGGAPLTTGSPMETSMMTAPSAADMMARAGSGFRGFMNRMAIRILGADTGRVLFSPLQPLQPIAQQPETFAPGRAFDYMLGYNTRVIPRSGEPVSFRELRALADGYDVLRIMIERVKDKIVSQKWAVTPRDEKAERDARCDEIEDFLAFPDSRHTFDEWTRMLLDQVLVYDAPAVFMHNTVGGDLYALEIIDGTTISIKLGPDGRVPTPDIGPAYQQVLKGLPAVDYIQPVPTGQPVPVDPEGNPFPELLYRPRNPRVDRVYGYSPVEQIITTVRTAMRAEQYTLDYYMHGATPDLLFQTPKEWSSKQIADFSDYFNDLLAGNLAGRRQAMFVPGGDGLKPMDTKEKAILNPEVNEWLVRICCFALGLNPMPFIKQMNRGQEKTHHEEAAVEGLEPWLEWFAGFINVVIVLKWGYRDLRFQWKEDEVTDPLMQAQIAKIYCDAKVYHPDEIRAKLGDDAMDPAMREQMNMATFAETPNATALPEDQQAAADERNAAQAEARAKLMPPPPVTNVKVDAPIKVDVPDVFVDVGATNVKVEAAKGGQWDGERKIDYDRDANGNLVAKITETRTRTVRHEHAKE